MESKILTFNAKQCLLLTALIGILKPPLRSTFSSIPLLEPFLSLPNVFPAEIPKIAHKPLKTGFSRIFIHNMQNSATPTWSTPAHLSRMAYIDPELSFVNKLKAPMPQVPSGTFQEISASAVLNSAQQATLVTALVPIYGTVWDIVAIFMTWQDDRIFIRSSSIYLITNRNSELVQAADFARSCIYSVAGLGSPAAINWQTEREEKRGQDFNHEQIRSNKKDNQGDRKVGTDNYRH